MFIQDAVFGRYSIDNDQLICLTSNQVDIDKYFSN